MSSDNTDNNINNEINNYIANSTSSHNLGPPTETNMIMDTGCTVHLCTPETQLVDRQITTTPITITIPDGSTMTSTHEGHLDIPELPPAATLTHVVPELNTHSLISIGQLCDAGCTATVDSNKIDVSFN